LGGYQLRLPDTDPVKPLPSSGVVGMSVVVFPYAPGVALIDTASDIDATQDTGAFTKAKAPWREISASYSGESADKWSKESFGSDNILCIGYSVVLIA
jgi:hypothetical protein